jgi:hypothetical protein
MNLDNLMGYDLGITTLPIPLYTVYTKPEVYHVNNPSTSTPFLIGSGDDNKFCGYIGWPCKTI